jgi:tryptophan 2,3-dioxygenase
MNYCEYLRLDELLRLQCPVGRLPRANTQAEVFFIIAHQASELWLKVLIGELSACQDAVSIGHTLSVTALQHGRRALAAAQMLEVTVSSLRSLDAEAFLAFREKLGTASGGQSTQFSELRGLVGWGCKEGSAIERRLREMARAPRGDGLASAPWGEPVRGDLRAFTLCLLDIASALWRWGVYHLDIVARTIGARPGTGGTSGASYLADRLFERPFPTLWAFENEAREPPASASVA